MQKIFSSLKPWHLISLLILANISLAFFIGDRFGEAWDEPSYYLYGERSYEAYTRGLTGQPLVPERHIYFIDLRYYGPFYTAIGWKIVNTITASLPNWSYPDLWHLVNFYFFQLALITLYHLAKRFVNEWTSVGVVFLFATQPLLFGHAFINPKDIPFLTFFLISVTTGLNMVDQMKRQDDLPASSFNFKLVIAILAFLFVLTFVCKDVISSAIGKIISSIYNAPSNSFGGRIFALLANPNNRLPVDNYIHKAVAAHIERFMIAFVFLLVYGRKLHNDYTNGNKVSLPHIKSVISLLIAGVALGLTTSIRLLGPFAGILIAVYALAVFGKKTLPNLIYYFSIAAIVCLLAWPFLWDSPTFHFFESFQVMKNFPFDGEVRFLGDNSAPQNLPWFYIPFLVSVQMTEPIVILAWVGLVAFCSRIWKEKSERPKWLLLLIWLVLPVGLQVTLHSGVYDNFRQFLFILPPMFILAGLGWDTLNKWLKNPTGRVVLFLLCAGPGVAGCVSLHPYQYIYYNSFVGGVRGAAGNFETDYWLTAYRETTQYLNENAPMNANILAWGAGYNIRDFARKDIAVFDFNLEEEIVEPYEYAIITTRFDNHINLFKDAEVVYEVRKNGTVLAVVKKLR